MFVPSPAWPHGELRELLPDLFYVVGTNKVLHADLALQTSRTMLVIRAGETLTLVNTLRLDATGLQALDELGNVAHVVRLGAFHGRDDPFYCDRYAAKLWALPAVTHADSRATDGRLQEGAALPVSGARVLELRSAQCPEAALWLPHAGGVLVTCDSIQNWSRVDEFFSEETGALFTKQGLIREANLPSTWLGACQPTRDDFDRLLQLPFRHLITAHGEPLLDDAHARVQASIERAFPRV